MTCAHVHGRHHDLWWELPLEASFRWQALVHDIPPALYRRRLARLVRVFALSNLLMRRAQDLTDAQRARAALAVALLPRPDLLRWEEPFAFIPPVERPWVAERLRLICRSEGLRVEEVS